MEDRRSIPRVVRFPILAILLAVSAVAVTAESDETSAIMGKQSFRIYCASCHGVEARGDGAVAEHLRVRPADLTRISQKNGGEFPFEQVFQTIDGRKPARGHGNRDMPIWGDAFKLTRDNPDEDAIRAKITDLVHFLQSIQEESLGR